MPERKDITKAKIYKISWGNKTAGKGKNRRIVERPKVSPEAFEVQFNPQTINLSYSNAKSGNDQRGGSSIQFVGHGKTTLSMELLFDITVPVEVDGSQAKDVRQLTQKIIEFLVPDNEKNFANKKQKKRKIAKLIPDGIRIAWGNLTYDGVVSSIKENLDFFSHDGRALRATLTIEVARQNITIQSNFKGPGTNQQNTLSGVALQQSVGGREDWQGIAEANGIENPRFPGAGLQIDLNAGVEVSASASVSVSATASAGIQSNQANRLSIGTARRLGFGASSRASIDL